MKKGLKKFLGVAMVSGISASASAIGSNYCGANAVFAASVPGMTEEKVKIMNAFAEEFLIFNEMVHTDSSQWVKFSGRIKELAKILKAYKVRDFGETLWEDNCSKNSEWMNADHARLEYERIIKSTKGLSSKLQGFLMYLGLLA